MATSFGPSALATPANAVTIGRVAITPVLLLLILDTGASWPGFVLWVALAGTDGVDGYLARRHGTTRSGAFLDPLADKFLVMGALIALVIKGIFWWTPVALIAVREIWMSGYRAWASRRGVSIPARPLAKAKTVFQAVAVGFALLPVDGSADGPGIVILWAAAVLTVVSGIQYWIDGRKVAAGAL